MEMKQIGDEKQVDGMSQGKESKFSSTSSRIDVDDTEMKQVDDEKPVGDGMSQGKESKDSSKTSRMESDRIGKSFVLFLDLYLPTVKCKYFIGKIQRCFSMCGNISAMVMTSILILTLTLLFITFGTGVLRQGIFPLSE